MPPLHPLCLVLHGNTVAVTTLVDSVEALSVLDGNVELLTELLERLVRRQVQTVKAETGERGRERNYNDCISIHPPLVVKPPILVLVYF